jgi:hemoglobin
MSDETQPDIYTQLGERDGIMTLAHAFYDAMELHEPALTAVHQQDEQGRVTQNARDRFGLFLVGWFGGPQEYMQRYGHPRLRMRHMRVSIDEAMRDAWTRSMGIAMDHQNIDGPLREFLDARFAQVADFLRNAPTAK